MLSRGVPALLLALAPFVQYGAAQSATPEAYTDPDTGITFDTWSASDTQTPGGMTFGFAFPSDALENDADEFIGIFQCSSENGKGTGWCGLSLGGPMVNNLLLMAWPHEDEVLTQFLWATAYENPVPFKSDAKVTQISSTIDESGFTLIYRCQNCLSWERDGTSGGQSTSSAFLLLGWCQSSASPGNAECPADITLEQHDNQSIFGASLDENAVSDDYDEWAALATKTVTGECDGDGGGDDDDPPPPDGTPIPIPDGSVYDYIVVGGGAGGLPIADRLSEAGHKVLLIEKGPPSSDHWGGEWGPEWLADEPVNRFDVPGLCNEIWVNSTGVACRDTDQMAGCVLGGGTAVNAGLWWKPNPEDWDYNFPNGWKADDMKAATERVFSRIPGTTVPSQDGKLYLTQGYDVITSGLKESGWSFEDLNSVPAKKNHTYGHGPFMFSGGERGGPMATYLKTADKRKNFDWWTNTQVRRLVRQSGHVTGVEVEPYAGEGYEGTVDLTSITGRVILSAGTFGSAKILLRSGIGPQDQLKIVQGSETDGDSMISSDQWIDLPVGYNLEDHTNTDTVITHPDVVFYDFYEAFDDPIESDAKKYLDERSGILAQAAPNIGPLMFDEITGADGVVRQLEWTCRVEGGHGVDNGIAMVMSQYLGRGAVSRGRMTINSALNTVVSEAPYLHNDDDTEAVIKGIENLQAALANVEGLVWQFPAEGESVRDFVNDMVKEPSVRRANHWIGTNKLGKDDGRNGGDCVVDLNTKVYGTDNVFVVDASIFPGMVTANPSAYIVVASEHASKKILDLADNKAVDKYSQCGGKYYDGSYVCAKGSTCKAQNEYYSQCV